MFFFVIGTPLTRIFPDVGLSIPLRCLKRVDFPAPFAPRSATRSPRHTLKFAPFRAIVPPLAYVCVRFFASTIMSRSVALCKISFFDLENNVFSISSNLASGFISICAAFSDDSTIGRFFFDIRATNSPITSKSNVPLPIAATSPNIPKPPIE